MARPSLTQRAMRAPLYLALTFFAACGGATIGNTTSSSGGDPSSSGAANVSSSGDVSSSSGGYSSSSSSGGHSSGGVSSSSSSGGYSSGGASSSSSGGSSSSSSSGGASTCVPKSRTSTQTVTIVVTNHANADRYLVTAGQYCDAYAIVPGNGAPLNLDLGFQCGCECPSPAIGPLKLERLAPGESATLTWNATQLVTCTYSLPCGAPQFPNESVPMLAGGQVPVAAGSYEASVIALASAPAECSSSDNKSYWCSPMRGPGNPPPPMSAIAAQCTARGSIPASAGFVLPATGDVRVDVAVAQ